MVAMGDKEVMPTTRRPKRTLARQIVLRMDQLSSKYTGCASPSMAAPTAVAVMSPARASGAVVNRYQLLIWVVDRIR